MASRVVAVAAVAATAALAVGPSLARPKAQTSRYFDIPAAEATARVHRFMAAHRIRVDGSGGPGMIRARGPSAQGEWVNCRARKGDIRAISFDLTVMIDEARRGGSTVTILLNGDAVNARRNHFLFLPTTIEKTPITCSSSGRMEKNLFAYLAQD
jgi:hypothetical protein